MDDQIEIYVRDNGQRTMLNIYIPARLREQFIASIRDGSFSHDEVPVALELSTQAKWITDDDQRDKAERLHEHVHVRVPINVINVQYTSD